MNTTVNNKWALFLRGIFLATTGILLLTIGQDSSKNNVLTFALLVLVAGLAGLGFASANKGSQLRTNWVLLESSADILFGVVAIYFYARSTDLTSDFLTAFGCFALVFTFLQVIYIFQIAQTGITPNIKIIAIRVLLSIIYGVVGIVLLFKSSFPDASTALINAVGFGPLLAGIAILVLSTKMYRLNKQVA